MTSIHQSKVESAFFNDAKRQKPSTQIPYLLVPNFPKLGLLTSLRFLEWVNEHPKGVISLPTGKTPEHFIKWTSYFLKNWDHPAARKIREENGLFLSKKPEMGSLHFVQMDEFYPINPQQANSFYNYVSKYYLEGFGLAPEKALLINSDAIELANGLPYATVFPDNKIDLSLRDRNPETKLEALQKESIHRIDNWCMAFEEKIRQLGGIGFFLGGIGPDGHIAFNTRGSDHHSSTRLTATNFETQAASASDLGGIENSRTRLVITIGLGTITFNKNAVAIIFAAGEAKALVVKNALENAPDVMYPATVLQKLPNARFYLTEGAAHALKDSAEHYYRNGGWSIEKTERIVFDVCQRLNKYAFNLTLDDLQNDEYACMIPNLSLAAVEEVIQSTREKIRLGLEKLEHQTFLHTGPHHDDIMLGIFPVIIPQLREASNKFHFSILTSGFTAVTNQLLMNLLNSTKHFIEQGRIEMISYDDFFLSGYLHKWDKDVAHYLNQVAGDDKENQLRGVCHRITRSLVKIYQLQSKEELVTKIENLVDTLQKSYDGEKNSPDIQLLKGMIREFEEELVWAHYGVQVKAIEHLRLGFYTGDIFTEVPDRKRDVEPILEMFRRIQPTVISLAFDPEGSGPDTHYKVLQAIAEAIRQWSKEKDVSKLKIVGYRNVWYRFMPHEANVFTPVSLNSMAVLNSSFHDCYISQVNASFPSFELDGPFSAVSQKIWVEQFKKVQLILGKHFFYDHESPKVRSTHGMIFHKEMSAEEFLNHARELEKSMEGG